MTRTLQVEVNADDSITRAGLPNVLTLKKTSGYCIKYLQITSPINPSTDHAVITCETSSSGTHNGITCGLCDSEISISVYTGEENTDSWQRIGRSTWHEPWSGQWHLKNVDYPDGHLGYQITVEGIHDQDLPAGTDKYHMQIQATTP
jgi:hypothetical protein